MAMTHRLSRATTLALVAVGMIKLAYIASGSLMAAGAFVHRLGRHRAALGSGDTHTREALRRTTSEHTRPLARGGGPEMTATTPPPSDSRRSGS